MEIGTFKVERIVDLPEIRVKLWILEDKITGAKVLHCETDDNENAFCISFATQPKTHNGVAHILEHTVLCGSKRFPVRDPFFLMQRRSLNTFLNAFTGGDFTCYPAATQNPKDFYNLLDVYLDAVFYPNLDRLSFLQEGHRLEYVDQKLKFGGVVFNEMKGALANPMARLEEEMNQRAYKGLTYAFNSGGDPKNIPELTHEELKEFHDEFYHPSRAVFYFYGNLPLEQHLKFLTEKVLKQTKKKEPLPKMPKLERLKKPALHRATYPIAKEEDPSDKTIVASTTITCSILDQVEALALSTLTVILLETDASPLKMALLKSGLCKQVLAHIDTEISEVPISIMFRGVKKEEAESLLQTLHSLVQEISHTPFSQEQIDSALHQLEFARTEITHDHLPYGLNLFMRAGLLFQHGGKPEDALTVHSLFNELKKRIKSDPKYFNELMKKWMVKNTHRVDLILEPDATLEEKENSDEAKRLLEIEKNLTELDKQRIEQESKALQELQDSDDSEKAVILPKLELADVPRECQNFPLYSEPHLFFHDTFTNDILYATLSFDLPQLKPDELPYLRLFSLLLTQLGAGEKSYVEMLDWMQAKTGGVYATLSLNSQVTNPNIVKPTLQLQGKALHHDQEELFKIFSFYMQKPNFLDAERVKEALLKHYTGLRNSITSSSLKYASGLATRGFSTSSSIGFRLFGLSWYWQVKSWVEQIDTQLPKILQKLQSLVPTLLGGYRELILSCTGEEFQKLKNQRYFGILDNVKGEQEAWKPELLDASLSQGRIVSSPVAFVSCALQTVGYTDPLSPSLHLASCLLDNEVLHTAIREKGGAYGGGSSYSASPGIFSFYSYRDPNIAKTIQTIEESVKELSKEELTDDQIVEGKLEMIQGFDAPVTPGSRGLVSWSWQKEGKTLEMRQAYRDRLLSSDEKKIREALGKITDPETIVAFAGKELLEKENSALEKIGKKPLPIYSIDYEL